MMTNRDLGAYWSNAPDDLAAALHTSLRGLSSVEAATRLSRYGPNALDALRPLSRVGVLMNQVRSPLLLLLIFAAAASGFTGEWFDAGIVLTIVVATVAVGYSREYSAQAAVDALRARVHVRAQVIRDGRVETVDTRTIVPGDLVLLSAGSLVPADALIIEATDFFLSEAVLTGESFPVQKHAGVIDTRAAVALRTNCVFLGTNVRSGTARCLVARTGSATEFGAIASRLMLRPPETEFDRGIRHFGYLLTSAMLILVVVVFTAHVLQGRPSVETLLFAIALAVGLSPELLPAILSVNLTRGARMMAHRGVLVRRLNAIENLGSMDILCTDKTGTLTEGVIRVEGAYDSLGAPSPDVLELAARNAALETGLDNPLDEAILGARRPDLSGIRKTGRDPVRLRSQACHRRRKRRCGRSPHHQGRLSPRSRGLHAHRRRRPSGRRPDSAARGVLGTMEQ
jgi:Mg2+-importing ATPase